MAAACSCCAGWKDDARGRVTSFVMRGVRHYLPEFWLACRAQRLGDGKDAVFQAMSQWAEQCALEAAWRDETPDACPDCGATLQRLEGQDGYRVDMERRSGATIEVRSRDVIYACPRCEHVESAPPQIPVS